MVPQQGLFADRTPESAIWSDGVLQPHSRGGSFLRPVLGGRLSAVPSTPVSGRRRPAVQGDVFPWYRAADEFRIRQTQTRRLPMGLQRQQLRLGQCRRSIARTHVHAHHWSLVQEVPKNKRICQRWGAMVYPLMRLLQASPLQIPFTGPPPSFPWHCASAFF